MVRWICVGVIIFSIVGLVRFFLLCSCMFLVNCFVVLLVIGDFSVIR